MPGLLGMEQEERARGARGLAWATCGEGKVLAAPSRLATEATERLTAPR